VAVSFSCVVFGQSEKTRFYKLNYIALEKESFSETLRKFVKDDALIFANSPTSQKTIKENPGIKDWENIKPGQKIRIYVESDLLSKKKFKNYRKEMKDLIAQNELDKIKKTKEAEEKIERLRFSLYYLASIAKYGQTVTEETDVNLEQRSAATVGGYGSYFVPGSSFSYSGNFWLGHSFTLGSNLSEETFDVPVEYNFGVQVDYHLRAWDAYISLGPTYEVFYTFDVDNSVREREIFPDKNSLVYASLTLSKNFNFKSSSLFSELSFSPTVLSSRTFAFKEADTSVGEFGGSRITFKNHFLFWERWIITSIFEMHSLEAEAEVTKTRVGLGFGIVLR
jgi:hypothetical protein